MNPPSIIANYVAAILALLKKRRRAAVLAGGVLLLAIFAWWIWSADNFTTEALTFKTNVVPGTTNDEPVDVSATLFVPKNVVFPVPAVVIAPSSSGVEEAREVYYARELANSGIAALILDSFVSRGLTDSVYDQSVLEGWDIENDAIAALAVLAADKRFKAERIGIMGVSKGGTVAMDTALTIRRKWMGVGKGLSFAAHVAISPDCTWITRRANSTGAPIFFMLAELDDQTPAAPCLEQVKRMQQAGNQNIEAKVYSGAHHAWEELGSKAQYDSQAENYSQCRVWVEDDGQMFAVETGELLPEDEWRDWAKQNCMTHGATCCGGSSRLKKSATQDIISFFRKSGF